jgi:hypothetical protein
MFPISISDFRLTILDWRSILVRSFKSNEILAKAKSQLFFSPLAEASGN